MGGPVVRLPDLPYRDLWRTGRASQPSTVPMALRGRPGTTSFEGAIPSSHRPSASNAGSAWLGPILRFVPTFKFREIDMGLCSGERGLDLFALEAVARPGPADLMRCKRTTIAVPARFGIRMENLFCPKEYLSHVVERVGRRMGLHRRARALWRAPVLKSEQVQPRRPSLSKSSFPELRGAAACVVGMPAY
jgi:hypothetical protein